MKSTSVRKMRIIIRIMKSKYKARDREKPATEHGRPCSLPQLWIRRSRTMYRDDDHSPAKPTTRAK